MKKLLLFTAFLGHLAIYFACSNNKFGDFEVSTDIGNPALAGETTYDPTSNTYTMKGAGYNIWFDRDEFQYVYKKMEGDFTLTAQVEFVGEGTDPHRKIGLMLRESEAEDAAHITATVHGDGLTVLQWRVAKGEEMRDPEDEIFAGDSHYDILQLERKGQEITMRAGKSAGGDMVEIGTHTMPNMPKEALLGIILCSHNPDVMEEAIISNVVIE